MQTTWLLLLHSVPPKPAYHRAKVMRRLAQLGALPLKRSAYVLPRSDETLEDFQWLQQEIRNEGGSAWLVEARFLAGRSDEELRESFRGMRARDYAELAADARALLDRVRSAGAGGEPESLNGERRRLLRRVEAVRRIDFFGADGRNEVEALMSGMNELRADESGAGDRALEGDHLRNRTWMTRRGVKVDRMASAWLIRRFIDPSATFVFVAPESEAARATDAVRFDMFGGEFTHDGDRCTFEVLVDAAGRRDDRGLAALAQIVHDIDLRDERFQRPETQGVAALVQGIAARHDDDHRRLVESGPLFDALYASLGGTGLSH